MINIEETLRRRLDAAADEVDAHPSRIRHPRELAEGRRRVSPRVLVPTLAAACAVVVVAGLGYATLNDGPAPTSPNTSTQPTVMGSPTATASPSVSSSVRPTGPVSFGKVTRNATWPTQMPTAPTVGAQWDALPLGARVGPPPHMLNQGGKRWALVTKDVQTLVSADAGFARLLAERDSGWFVIVYGTDVDLRAVDRVGRLVHVDREGHQVELWAGVAGTPLVDRAGERVAFIANEPNRPAMVLDIGSRRVTSRVHGIRSLAGVVGGRGGW